MLRKQKGQGLTEFALILPLLLLLLLGIIEAARVIWAYITVQQAAREAARYAVTGRPYLDSNINISGQLNICNALAGSVEPDPIKMASAQPWLCPEEIAVDGTPYNSRVNAIKAMAIRQGRTLNVSMICGDDDPDEYDSAGCRDQPGAFGVLIQGQVTTKTITGTTVVAPDPVIDHPGLQGLNVQINTFYNVEMITPVFDILMGGNFLRLEGRVQLQNEGLDEAAGIEPPPGINPPPPPAADDDGGTFVGDPEIHSPNGYTFQQSDLMIVHLKSHATGSYNIYLLNETGTAYKLKCGGATVVTTNASNETNPDPSCELKNISNGTYLAPGPYTLYSTVDGLGSAHATALEPVTIVLGGTPKIEFEDGNDIWAAKSDTYLKLLFHDPVNLGPYQVKLFDKNNNPVNPLIAASASGNSTEQLAWSVHDIKAIVGPGGVCDWAGGNPCKVRSYDKNNNLAAEADVYINQPQIILSSGPGPYARGEVVFIHLRAHTPGKRYTVNIQGQSPDDKAQRDTLDTNGAGDTVDPVPLTIPTGCGSGTGWPDGTYQVTSIPLGFSTPVIASNSFQVSTPPAPFITVDGGYTWTAGSSIDIRLHQHITQTLHYLEFDGTRIPTIASDDTFLTGNCGDAIVNFTIPETTAEGTYTLASFLDSNDSNQASRDIFILDQPLIRVLEGSSVAPDQTITIELTNHVPNTSYRVFYADKQLFGVLTDDQGKATVKYNLGKELPKLPKTPPPDLTNSSSYGVAYEMNSQTVSTPAVKVAKTFLTLQGVDLVVTMVKVPVTATISSTVPIKVVVQNLYPITINHAVDIDLYFNPEPVAPSYLKGYNFPGDIKYWKSSIGASEIFTISHNLTIKNYGLQDIYGYADTSAKVYESEQPGQANNPNNLKFSTLLVNCVGDQFTDAFGTNYAQGAAIPGWSWQTYGNGDNQGFTTQVQGGQLILNNSGSSIWQTDDGNGGQSFFYRTGAVPSASGLDVAVQVSSIDLQGTWSGAGLEIRNSLDPTSPRIVLGVARNNGTSSYKRHFIRPGYRNGGGMTYFGGTESQWRTNHQVDLVVDGPVWLRIQRQAGTNGQFNIYYRQTSSLPPAFGGDAAAIAAWWGAAKANVTINGIGDSVYVGLFNVPYQSSQAGNGKFEEFRLYPDPAFCVSLEPPAALPPGLQVCNEVLEDRSFENPATSTSWFQRPEQPAGVVFRTSDAGANNGVFKYRASSGTDSSVNTDFHFFQEFTMPDWVLSSTTKLDVQFYKRIRSYMSSSSAQAADKVYAVVVAVPAGITYPHPSTWIQLTNPVEVVNGTSSAPMGSFETNWTFKTATLPVASGVNLENYANKKLFLYFYNNSNVGTPVCSGPCRTQFDFDDAGLTSCTTQLPPASISTRIKGKLTLNFSDGTFAELPYVKVWAYATNDSTVYETFSIQGGEFNFYNLPATAAGTEYTIFAQYYLEQGNQVEVLAADTTTILRAGVHTNSNPALAFMNLFTLAPLQ